MVKTLENILSGIDKIEIMYRGITPQGNDIFVGFCNWDNGKLISADDDDYCLDDEIIDYKFEKNEDETTYLVIWQKL